MAMNINGTPLRTSFSHSGKWDGTRSGPGFHGDGMGAEQIVLDIHGGVALVPTEGSGQSARLRRRAVRQSFRSCSASEHLPSLAVLNSLLRFDKARSLRVSPPVSRCPMFLRTDKRKPFSQGETEMATATRTRTERPVKTFRYGRIQAAIWVNGTESVHRLLSLSRAGGLDVSRAIRRASPEGGLPSHVVADLLQVVETVHKLLKELALLK